MLDLKVTILGFGYHVTCQYVPELAGMRWNRIDQHLIRYYQNILQTTRVLLGRYIKHFLLHVNSTTDRKTTILNKILRYFRDTYFTWNIQQISTYFIEKKDWKVWILQLRKHHISRLEK